MAAVLFSGAITWDPDRCDVCGRTAGERYISHRRRGSQTVTIVLCRVPGGLERDRRCRRHLLDVIRPVGKGRRPKVRERRAVPAEQLELCL